MVTDCSIYTNIIYVVVSDCTMVDNNGADPAVVVTLSETLIAKLPKNDTLYIQD